jgi:beta-phosphoglucomutase-like phosphatase (HAD superfamily)
MAAERLGVPAHSCAVVEDAVHGIEAARRAGMSSIALTGTATRDELAHADMIVESLRHLSPGVIRRLIEK